MSPTSYRTAPPRDPCFSIFPSDLSEQTVHFKRIFRLVKTLMQNFRRLLHLSPQKHGKPHWRKQHQHIDFKGNLSPPERRLCIFCPFRLLIPFFEKRATVSRIASSRHRHPCDSCVIGPLALSTSFHLFAPFCASTGSSSLSLLRLFSFASALLSSSSLIHYALPCVSGRAACPDYARQPLPLFKELRDSQRSALC